MFRFHYAGDSTREISVNYCPSGELFMPEALKALAFCEDFPRNQRPEWYSISVKFYNPIKVRRYIYEYWASEIISCNYPRHEICQKIRKGYDRLAF